MTKHKNIRKSMSLMLCLSLMCALLLACSGCGNKEKDALVGTWETTLDMTDMVNDEMKAGLGSDAAEMMKYLTIDDFSIKVSLTFNSDDTYKMSVDEKALEDCVDNVINIFRDGIEKYFEELIAQQGIDMTVDEVLEAMNMGTLDDLIEEAFDRDDLMSSVDDMESSGKFEVKGGVMYLTDKDGTGMESYKLDGNKLTLTGEGVDDSDLEAFYPLVFTKK